MIMLQFFQVTTLALVLVRADAFALYRSPACLVRRRSDQTILCQSTVTSAASTTNTAPRGQNPADWHRQRRREMMEKYGDELKDLEQSNSQSVGAPLLAATCLLLWVCTFVSSTLPVWAVLLLAVFPGSVLSLWQLQLLHDVIHGVMFEKPNKQLQDSVLFWASMPSAFGYYLYLKAGHLSHHRNLGQHTLSELFESDQVDFEDGDALFVAHRMKMAGDYGPRIPIPFTDQSVKLSISKSGFHFWKEGATIRNSALFATSFLYERILLVLNDGLVAVLGRNLYFPNKPDEFQEACVDYARVASVIRMGLLLLSWKTLLFLYLSESLWSLPPHPACAMFVTNHGSTMINDDECVPTKSTYAGLWYSLFTLGTNFHVEHHDFPAIPFHRLHQVRKIAPEYYQTGSGDNLFEIMNQTFSYPEFYACMDAGAIAGSWGGNITMRN